MRMLRGSWRAAGIGVFISILCAGAVNNAPVFAFSGSGTGTSIDPYQITTCAQLHSIDSDLDAYYDLANDIDCTSVSGSWTPIGAVGSGFTGTLDGQNHKITHLDLSGISNTTNFAGMFGVIEGAAAVKDILIIDGKLNAGNNSGMVAGGIYDTATLDDVYVQATVTCHGDNCGGMVGGLHDASVINDSGADVTVTNNDISTGGLVGWVSGTGTIQKSFANGYIAGTLYVGGLIGAVNNGSNVATVTNAYANVTAVGSEYVGGIAGMAIRLNLTNSYAAGAVSGTNTIGGLAGIFYGHMAETFAANKVTGTGGAVGPVTGHFAGGTVGNRYFDTNITGFSSSPDGSSPITNSDYFRDSSTNPPFDQWNFSTMWRTNYANYPSFAPKIDPYMLCEAPQSTATTITATCDVAPLGWGTPTWQARWSVKGANDWHAVTLNDTHKASATVTGLNPNTEYDLAFRYTNDFGTGPWGNVNILTIGHTTSPVSANPPGVTVSSILQGIPVAIARLYSMDVAADTVSDDEDVSTPEIAQQTTDGTMEHESRDEVTSPIKSVDDEQAGGYNWVVIGSIIAASVLVLWLIIGYIRQKRIAR